MGHHEGVRAKLRKILPNGRFSDDFYQGTVLKLSGQRLSRSEADEVATCLSELTPLTELWLP
eukprot:m.356159 g.356159  ORF g.356159 m.356159 type:complete len:62 (+) comp86899_c0_seq1:114-299(+)